MEVPGSMHHRTKMIRCALRTSNERENAALPQDPRNLCSVAVCQIAAFALVRYGPKEKIELSVKFSNVKRLHQTLTKKLLQAGQRTSDSSPALEYWARYTKYQTEISP